MDDLHRQISDLIAAEHELREGPIDDEATGDPEGRVNAWPLDEGYVEAFAVSRGEESYDTLTVTLKYADDRRRVIQGIKRISKPGRRIYAKADVEGLRSVALDPEEVRNDK